MCLAGLGTTSTPSPTVQDNYTISRTRWNAQAAQAPRRIGRPWHASCAAGSDPVRGWLLQITQGNNGEALKLFERAALAAPTMVRAYEGIGAAHFGENELPQVPLSRTTVANHRLRMGAKWHKMHHAESRRSLRLRVERRRLLRADSGRHRSRSLQLTPGRSATTCNIPRSPVQATRAFRTAVRLAPHSLAALRNLAASLGKAEDLEAASSAYTKASVARVDD